MSTTTVDFSKLTHEELKRLQIQASQQHHRESLERYARETNDIELAKRNGFDLSKPPSWEREEAD